MGISIDKALEGADVAIEFVTSDEAAIGSIKQAFADDEILESHAFSGAAILTVLTKIGQATVGKLFGLAASHDKAIRSCNIKIGKKELALSGFTAPEIEKLIKSGDLLALVREYKK